MPLTCWPHTVPVYVTRKSAALSGVAVPPNPYEQLFAAVPLVVQFSVVPFSVPLPVPVTATPLHVAE